MDRASPLLDLRHIDGVVRSMIRDAAYFVGLTLVAFAWMFGLPFVLLLVAQP